jgi:outer membrane protein assembly factor BamB
MGPDGTLYVASSGSAPAVTALEAKTLEQKDWYAAAGQDLSSSPVIFEFKDKALLAVASKNKKIILLDTKSLGGADHRTPLFTGAVEAVPQTLASWQDAAGTRWLLGNTEGAIRAWKVVDHNGAPSLETAWTSPEIAAPLAPIVVNGVVFAASRGSRSSPAVLYALDSSSGKELWNSGKIISSTVGESGLSAGDTQVFVGAADGTLFAFGFPIEH